jgi:DNA-binding response OmpR family regulator
VEDSATIRVSLASGLSAAGHEVLERADGMHLESDLREFRPDVVILDVMLPGRDGFTLLDRIRSTCDAGVVMLTARDGVEDRLHGLDAGADDYVTKPFVLPEVLSRVNALLRRLGRSDAVLTLSDLRLDPTSGLAFRAGVELRLTAKEFQLLRYLVENRGRVLNKSQILAAVWGLDAWDPNLVEVFVSSLRRKLEAYGPRLLHTSRGLGYVMREDP